VAFWKGINGSMQKEWQNPTLEELATLLWLNSVPRIGPAASKLLLAHYRTPRDVFGASNYQEVPGLQPHMVEELQRAPKVLTPFSRKAEQVLSQVEQFGISIVTPLVPAYPRQLLGHPSYGPSILYAMGDVTCLSLAGGALVGTRAPSAEAKERTRQAAITLVRSGQAIFSGMAKGIDAEGHRGALEAGGKTVAVLGCGVNRVYPADHADLYERIRHTGAIVSEYPPGTPPSPENLRRRNKLIVGLSRFVVVAECPADSGAIIAARSALQQQRPLFVLKLDLSGFAQERSGTHLLSSSGLAAIWDGRDINWLERYTGTYTRPPSAEARLDEALGKSRQAGQKRRSATTGGTDIPQTIPTPHAQAEDAGLLGITPSPSTKEKRPQERVSQEALSSPQYAPFTENQRVRHPKFGDGVIKRIDHEAPGSIEVAFENRITKKIAFEYVHLLEAL
jgi:DNA processing protein